MQGEKDTAVRAALALQEVNRSLDVCRQVTDRLIWMSAQAQATRSLLEKAIGALESSPGVLKRKASADMAVDGVSSDRTVLGSLLECTISDDLEKSGMTSSAVMKPDLCRTEWRSVACRDCNSVRTKKTLLHPANPEISRSTCNPTCDSPLSDGSSLGDDGGRGRVDVSTPQLWTVDQFIRPVGPNLGEPCGLRSLADDTGSRYQRTSSSSSSGVSPAELLGSPASGGAEGQMQCTARIPLPTFQDPAAADPGKAGGWLAGPALNLSSIPCDDICDPAPFGRVSGVCTAPEAAVEAAQATRQPTAQPLLALPSSLPVASQFSLFDPAFSSPAARLAAPLSYSAAALWGLSPYGASRSSDPRSSSFAGLPSPAGAVAKRPRTAEPRAADSVPLSPAGSVATPMGGLCYESVLHMDQGEWGLAPCVMAPPQPRTRRGSRKQGPAAVTLALTSLPPAGAADLSDACGQMELPAVFRPAPNPFA